MLKVVLLSIVTLSIASSGAVSIAGCSVTDSTEPSRLHKGSLTQAFPPPASCADVPIDECWGHPSCWVEQTDCEPCGYGGCPDCAPFVRCREQTPPAPDAGPPVLPTVDASVPATPCTRGGCNGELCGANLPEVASICIIRPEDTCYQQAACERQTDGQCGFTPSLALTECLHARAY